MFLIAHLYCTPSISDTPDGGDFEFCCGFHNTSDQRITYGYETSDEMCMLAGVYYPDGGIKLCSRSP